MTFKHAHLVAALCATACLAAPAAARDKAPAGAEQLTPASLLAASCAACHGTQGRSVTGTPVLAGMARDQLVTSLKEFQNGSRKATVMHRHAKGYTDQEIELLADYFAAQKR